jgi:hypothetical protein
MLTRIGALTQEALVRRLFVDTQDNCLSSATSNIILRSPHFRYALVDARQWAPSTLRIFGLSRALLAMESYRGLS